MMKRLLAVMAVCCGLFILFLADQASSQAQEKVGAGHMTEGNIDDEAELIKAFQEAVAEVLGSYEAIGQRGTVHIDRTEGFRIVVGIKQENETTTAIRKALEERFGNTVIFKEAPYTLAELTQMKDKLFADVKLLRDAGIEISSAGVDEAAGKIRVVALQVDDMAKARTMLMKYGDADIIQLIVDPQSANQVGG